MQGIETLEKPLEVNTIDWTFERFGCDALVLKDNQCSTMKILAYAIEPRYNVMLNDFQIKNDNSVIFKNTDNDEVNAIDSLPVGMLSEYADKDKIPLEERAFEYAMIEKYNYNK